MAELSTPIHNRRHRMMFLNRKIVAAGFGFRGDSKLFLARVEKREEQKR